MTERRAMAETVFLREIDAGTECACWIVCAKGEPGAIEFEPIDGFVFPDPPEIAGEPE